MKNQPEKRRVGVTCVTHQQSAHAATAAKPAKKTGASKTPATTPKTAVKKDVKPPKTAKKTESETSKKASEKPVAKKATLSKPAKLSKPSKPVKPVEKKEKTAAPKKKAPASKATPTELKPEAKKTTKLKTQVAPEKPAQEKDTPAVSSLQEGMPAPDFTLPATTGVDITLKDLKGGQLVVLYFYPKDDTPGCTIEAKDFQNLKSQFARQNVLVLGISPNRMGTHKRFAAKYGLTFPLLSDRDKQICKAYDVWQEKVIFGKKFMGIARTTFIIGTDGVIKKIFRKIKVQGHAKEVLAAVKAINKNAASK
jgi:peroxiredoxin Q/BCP